VDLVREMKTNFIFYMQITIKRCLCAPLWETLKDYIFARIW